MYSLPPEVDGVDRHAVKVIVTGVAPKDKDVEWPPEPYELVKKYIFGQFINFYFIIALVHNKGTNR